MKVSDVARIVDTKANGSFFRMRYLVEAPVTKEYKETHTTIPMKEVEATVRSGCNYGNLGAVKAEKEMGVVKKKRANNYHALIENKVYYNTNTKQYYLYVFPTENDNYKASYDKEVKYDELKHTNSKPIIKKIKVENILEIM